MSMWMRYCCKKMNYHHQIDELVCAGLCCVSVGNSGHRSDAVNCGRDSIGQRLIVDERDLHLVPQAQSKRSISVAVWPRLGEYPLQNLNCIVSGAGAHCGIARKDLVELNTQTWVD